MEAGADFTTDNSFLRNSTHTLSVFGFVSTDCGSGLFRNGGAGKVDDDDDDDEGDAEPLTAICCAEVALMLMVVRWEITTSSFGADSSGLFTAGGF